MIVIMVIIIWRRFDVFWKHRKIPNVSYLFVTVPQYAHLVSHGTHRNDRQFLARLAATYPLFLPPKQPQFDSAVPAEKHKLWSSMVYCLPHPLDNPCSLGSSILLVTLKPDYLLIPTSRRVRDPVSYSYETIGKSGGTTGNIKFKYT